MYTNPNSAPASGFSQYPPLQNQYLQGRNHNHYPPPGNQYPPIIGKPMQPYQHDQYNMYQQQQGQSHQNQGYPNIQNANYPSPYTQPGYGPVIQNQPNALQPSPQVMGDGWMPIPQAIPQNCPDGLQYLSTINQLLVKQKVEIIEALVGFETNNKYTIKNSLGQKVFYAVEENDCCTRNCFGSMRPFEMKIFDNFKNEIIHLSRPLPWQSCFFPCMQKIEVFSPPGCLVGVVEQDWSILTPMFTIRNAAYDEVLKIEGPICRFSMCGDVEFKILSKDKTTVVGRISKQWSGFIREAFTDADFFGITFPLDLDVHMKAVMLGACFLIDVMFYEESDGIEFCL